MTILSVDTDPKTLREALCVAEHAVNRTVEPQNQHGAPRILAALIRECDRHRPIGPNGKHGERHTLTCGCEGVLPKAPPPAWPTSREEVDAWQRAYRLVEDLADDADAAAARGVDTELNTYLAGSLRMRVAFARVGVVPPMHRLRPARPMPAPGEHPVGDRCDVCSNPFESGQWWTYHARLQVYVHASCAATSLVRGEDISSHTVLMGQMP